MFIKRGKFYADWRDKDGRRRRKNFGTANAAMRFEQEQKAQAASDLTTGVHVFLVHEKGGEFIYYEPGTEQPLTRFAKERQVIEAARNTARALGLASTRVVFAVPTKPESY
jgi:hypothetical protein